MTEQLWFDAGVVVWATVWRIVVIFVGFSLSEHQAHVWVLHGGLIRRSRREHHVEHHGQGQNKLRPHIDLGIPDLIIPALFACWSLYRALYVNPYAWIGVVLIVTIAFGHQYFWSRLHRAIHREHDEDFRPVDLISMSYDKRGARLEENWTTSRWWFRAFELHHLKHHANPSKNLSVVFLWTDRLMGTMYDRLPWWVGGGASVKCASRSAAR